MLLKSVLVAISTTFFLWAVLAGVPRAEAVLSDSPAQIEKRTGTGKTAHRQKIRAVRKTAETRPEKKSAGKKSSASNRGKRKKRSNGRVELNKNYFKGIFSDTGYILRSPFNWKTSDWVKTSLILGTTGAFMALDNDIKEVAQDNRSNATDDLSDVFETFGNGAYSVPGLALFYLYGHFLDDYKVRRVSLLALESFAITGLFTLTLKYAGGRHRPSTDDSSTTWDGPTFSGNASFPSGHTSTVFAIATVLANEYEDNLLVPPVAYGVATMTALSRINDNKHWASDVFFGGALGYFTAKTVLKLNSDKKGNHFTVFPRVTEQETGLVFSYRF